MKVWTRRVGMAVLVILTLAMATLAALPFLGGHLLVVTSGSMRPAIQPGDAIVVFESEPATIQRGEVIAFRGYGGEGLTTHRVVGFHEVDGRRHFLTQGDANERRDRDAAPPSGLVGTVELTLPGFGWMLNFLASTLGRVVVLALPAALIGGAELRDLLHDRRVPAKLRGLDRRAHVRPAEVGLAATGVLLLATAQLAMAAGPTRALMTHTSVVADNAVATVDVAPPTNVTATFDCGSLGLGKGILVDWDAVSEADSYEVARSTSSGGPYDLLATVDGSNTSHFDDTVDNSTTYYYVVRTVAGDWTSANSTEASETTPSSTECLV